MSNFGLQCVNCVYRYNWLNQSPCKECREEKTPDNPYPRFVPREDDDNDECA